MRRVLGRVIMLESGRGLPNLVVAAFDVDEPFEPDAPDWAIAQRLGSAATDDDGSFVIEYEESDFDDEREAETRPDTVVAVFGPHVAGSDRDPDAEPVFWTRGVREEAGGVEAYVLAIPESMIPEIGTTPTDRDEPAHATVVSAVRRNIAKRAAFSAAVKEAIAPEVHRRLTTQRRSSTIARRILGGPRTSASASGERFVEAGTSPAAALHAAREAGLESMRTNADAVRGLTFRASSETYERLGFILGPQGDWTTPPRGVDLDDIYQEAGTDVTLPAPWRAKLRLDACRNKKRAGAAFDSPPTPAPPDTDDGSGADGAVDIPALAGQLLSGLSEGVRPGTTRPNMAEVCGALQGSFCGGPADEPSYHDFHTLQAAWRDVWTSVIDSQTEDEITEIYESIVDIVEWSTIAGDDSEIEELDEFLARLARALDVAAAATGGTDAPPELVEWVPELEDGWSALSPEHRDYMAFLHAVDSHHAGIQKWFGALGWVDILSIPPKFDHRDHHTLDEAAKNFETLKLEEKYTKGVVAGELHPGWGASRARAILLGLATTAEGESWVPSLGRARRLLEGIRDRMAEPYRFRVFVPGSYNFGIVTTYRQKWEPLGYQVGELVGTIPLAPGEKRTYTKRRVLKTSRAQKEVEKAIQAHASESQETGRAESEIVRRASSSTNFSMSAEGGFNVAIASVNLQGQYGAKQSQASATTKRDFRERVRKASEEYRRERTLEIDTSRETVDEFVETGEIKNTNDELTVTYLLYELQRRIELSERLHRITPVVMIAFEVPAPNEIDEDWLLAHEWVLRRVILDDRLLRALDYLTDGFAGDELSVEVLRTQWETNIETVRSLGSNLGVRETLREHARGALRSALRSTGTGGGGGVLDAVGDFLFGDSDASAAAAAEARRQAAQQTLEWQDADFSRAEQELAGAVTALEVATESYTGALQRRLDRRTAIDQLRIHVKDNILYYMQAIWLHEPPDQRYFRVYDEEIGWPEGVTVGLSSKTITVKVPSLVKKTISGPLGHTIEVPGGVEMVETEISIPVPDFGDSTVALHEVADVDRLLGFKGNYAIFPLKKQNALTLFMAQAYLDSHWGVSDPDPYGELPSPTEAVEMAECAWQGASDDEKEAITTWLLQALDFRREVSEEITIPTGQLYIDALPGAHTLLEDFKLAQRRIETDHRQADMVKQRLEALRYAARLGASEYGDPEVETQIIGLDAAVLTDSDGPGETPDP